MVGTGHRKVHRGLAESPLVVRGDRRGGVGPGLDSVSSQHPFGLGRPAGVRGHVDVQTQGSSDRTSSEHLLCVPRRDLDSLGRAAFYGWSEDKARQVRHRERERLAAYLEGRKFSLG